MADGITTYHPSHRVYNIKPQEMADGITMYHPSHRVYNSKPQEMADGITTDLSPCRWWPAWSSRCQDDHLQRPPPTAGIAVSNTGVVNSYYYYHREVIFFKSSGIMDSLSFWFRKQSSAHVLGSIYHNHWWTALIKLRLLFFHVV